MIFNNNRRIRKLSLMQLALLIILFIIQAVWAVEFDDDIELTYTMDVFEGKEKDGKGGGNSHQPSKKTNPIDLNNVAILSESTPVKDSINYNGMVGYIFEPDVSSEWTHSYQILIYISASLCQLPSDWNTSSSENGLSLYYTFNRTVAIMGLTDRMTTLNFENGYSEGLAEMEIEDGVANYTLFIMVLPDDCNQCTNDSSWTYEFAVSQKNLLFLYDTEPYISVVDVDYDSVIFEANSISFVSDRSYGMYIFEDGDAIPTALNQSWCAISESTDYIMKVDIEKNTTLSIDNAFIVSGLEISKRYSAVLVVTFTDIPYGGGVFQQYGFTMSTSKACKLAYNLDFCDEVAYAIPVSTDFYNSDETWEQMIAAYDNYSESLYTPFEYAMQQIPCDTELDARYSPIRDCDDCKYSYKQWLCAVTIPRCISQAHAGPQNKLYAAGKGRNSFIADTISPPLEYAEVLPCLNVCQAIVRDCPSDFGFQCPEGAQLVALSYGDPTVDDDTTAAGISITTDATGSVETYRVCNYIGENNLSNSTSDS